MTDQEMLSQAFYGYDHVPIPKKSIPVKVKKISNPLPVTISLPPEVYRWLVVFGGAELSVSSAATQILKTAYRAAHPELKEAASGEKLIYECSCSL